MKNRVLTSLLFSVSTFTAAFAQETAWIQIEALPSQAQGEDQARFWAGTLDNVNGFSLGGRWHVVALGPFEREDANTLSRQLRRAGNIPRDAFVVDGERYGEQFWPEGGASVVANIPLPSDDATAETDDTGEQIADAPVEIANFVSTDADDISPTDALADEEPDETKAEAQRSEAALTREDKKALQIAMKWSGHYDAAIDGTFGRGTRAAMSSWQDDNGFENTGTLTTRQRAELVRQYNAVLDGMDLEMVRDDATGIEMLIPSGVVEFTKYQPPFAQFDAKTDLGVRLLLISQQGDQTRMNGLYEIMQTLEIVPTDGERTRSERSFHIEGESDALHSTTYVWLKDNDIKGFTLIWPADDEDRRRRVIEEMKTSFTRIEGVLDPAIAPPDDNQAIDLIAGLAIRKPSWARSGFYIDDKGTVATASADIASCSEVTIGADTPATVTYIDDALGVSVITPDDRQSPMGVALIQTGVPRLQAEVAVAGYPYGGVLTTPTLTFGTLADLRGLQGEDEVKRLALAAQPGNIGGPVFDNGGAVLGMLVPTRTPDGQMLPVDVSYSLDADALLGVLTAAGHSPETTDTIAFMPPETLTLRAADMTVLVNCWK